MEPCISYPIDLKVSTMGSVAILVKPPPSAVFNSAKSNKTSSNWKQVKGLSATYSSLKSGREKPSTSFLSPGRNCKIQKIEENNLKDFPKKYQ